ncbi:hypothetical protein [Paenibacillus alvei]|uniref:hypothetical protein n=1 Tax=Paenibacillus alvei TaxID=44250 RepID=UPI002280668F|nr:hypothetical protein [Paenibacillus alvei]MCY7488071.1 hypothetical protein [Paenibacillus alvei]
MQHIMQYIHKLFGAVKGSDWKVFFRKRLPVYVLGSLILLFYGVEGLVVTFFIVLSFVLGFMTKQILNAVKDYRLSLRLNRVYFSEAEYTTLKRERDVAMAALKLQQEERAEGGRRRATSTTMAPMARVSQMEIEEMMARMKEGEEI